MAITPLRLHNSTETGRKQLTEGCKFVNHRVTFEEMRAYRRQKQPDPQVFSCFLRGRQSADRAFLFLRCSIHAWGSIPLLLTDDREGRAYALWTNQLSTAPWLSQEGYSVRHPLGHRFPRRSRRGHWGLWVSAVPMHCSSGQYVQRQRRNYPSSRCGL